ncbi:SMP-30/gluconolactonase/LRE family protein [Streptomyces sp. NPDC049040]|uniref:SMP-30/gluconolactonase/LRE family protein n=1 Tax=Streptomyces sp. NPDC049040 TaxID=3365593 RepID=UPI00372355D5
MLSKSVRSLLVGVLASASLAVAWPAAAGVPAARTATVSQARVTSHFDLSAGQMPENIVVEPDGAVDLSFAGARQIVRIDHRGAIHVLATLPLPADGGANTPVLKFPLVTGLVLAPGGTLYFLYATGTADLTGVWRLNPGGTPHRIAALPADGLPNGLALDPHSRQLYATDSVRGVIWRVPTSGGTPTSWAAGPELASTGFLGANGIKVHDGAVWASNLDRGTVLRYPVTRTGAAGAPRTVADGLAGVDDFDFLPHGDRILAALNAPDQVALIEPDGSHTVVLSAEDGLRNPTAVAVDGSTVHVPSAAYTEQDPNLLTARLRQHG